MNTAPLPVELSLDARHQCKARMHADPRAHVHHFSPWLSDPEMSGWGPQGALSQETQKVRVPGIRLEAPQNVVPVKDDHALPQTTRLYKGPFPFTYLGRGWAWGVGRWVRAGGALCDASCPAPAPRPFERLARPT